MNIIGYLKEFFGFVKSTKIDKVAFSNCEIIDTMGVSWNIRPSTDFDLSFNIKSSDTLVLAPNFLSVYSNTIKQLDGKPIWRAIKGNDFASIDKAINVSEDGKLCLFTLEQPGVYMVELFIEENLTFDQLPILVTVFINVEKDNDIVK